MSSIDVHAFFAQAYAPGETAELFLSLCNEPEARFVSEECLCTNRPRRLLAELVVLAFLASKLSRNGSLKMSSNIRMICTVSKVRVSSRAAQGQDSRPGMYESIPGTQSEVVPEQCFRCTRYHTGSLTEEYNMQEVSDDTLVSGDPSGHRDASAVAPRVIKDQPRTHAFVGKC
ncbi:hypothetical protein BD310DRAFT_277318 [Dichomitus squalens]|uniref:Uncharacterized protein n=1 Tax=Dichomitus squalens TaxID=114155 RepID=A0A4Q9PBJ7_9APHY|nr:hypothetical protein BD310DRAFT_277318 [Dichomitus squalens]